MKILIVGADGLLGKCLVQQVKDEHKVYSLVRDENTANDIKMDLTDIDESVLPKDIDVIYYFAQSNRFREFPEGAEDMMDINVYAPVKLASWAQKNGVKKFIYASSGGVYKNPTEPVHEFFDINTNEKNGFYLDSKLSAEVLLRNFEDLFETFVIIRPFFMYGPEQNRSMLIPRLMDNIIAGNEIILTGEEGININPIYVEDAGEAMGKILNQKGKHLFNIAGDEVVSLKELCKKIGNIVNKKPKFSISNNLQRDLIADISLMKEKLISPKVNLNEGLKKLYDRIK